MLSWKLLENNVIMDLILLQKILNVYSWLLACIIMVFVSAIAHFYQKKFGTKTFSYVYILTIIVLIIPVVQLFPLLHFHEETIELLGSLSAFFATYYIYKKMVGVK